jgi:hypothetical protein
MRSFILQEANLGSRKQAVHLAILAVLGLLLLAGVAVVLVVFDLDPAEGGEVFLVQRKFPAAAFGPMVLPQGLEAAAWSSGSDKVYGLQLNRNTNVWVWELQLRGVR